MVQGGTIFLDEISTTGLDIQAKLLRVLQEHKVRRVGGQDLVDIDIRVLSATNEDLQEAIAQNRFRPCTSDRRIFLCWSICLFAG